MTNQSETQEIRYIIGIDLGTTNSAIAFIDTKKRPFSVEDFRVSQISAPGEVSSMNLFPSFHYEAARGELTKESLKLPWDTIDNPVNVAGVFARDHGAQIPGRLIFSAKSWLSHSGVDRTAPLLPWHSLPDVEKVSPLEITSRYLDHMRKAWNYDHPDFLMENQDVIITVPASFDEIARELTVQAAAQAGLKKIVLLEEPQAAFYAWIQQHAKDWQSHVNSGQKILICDIGGGTTDLTLIQVREDTGGAVEFHRIAVGDHLILGGDNLDLALAYYIEQKKLNGKKLSPRQFGALVRSCQKAKETLLGDKAPEQITLTIQGMGASLIGGSIQVEISQKEIIDVLIEGYFPFVKITDKPASRQSGFQEFGLPYAPDAAVTRYLASFLIAHRNNNMTSSDLSDIESARPDIILFNGGVFTSEMIQNRILDVLQSWFSHEIKTWRPVVFANDHPELAVARGASYFGLVRRGGGVRINAGLARSYYIGVSRKDAGTRALCLAPAGLQEGMSVDLQSLSLDLLIKQPVEFPLFVSSRRTTDAPGQIVSIDPLEMYPLPPIRTVLRSGKNFEADIVKVMLHVRLTEVGTLDLWCTEINGNRNWKLQFDVRSATNTDIGAHNAKGESAGIIDSEIAASCKDVIINAFKSKTTDPFTPKELVKKLEQISGMGRNDWPPSLLRMFWEVLMEVEASRSKDPMFEARWLNFLGFSLRPGYGFAIDDWRVKQTWLIFQKGVIHQRNQACKAEWWILWRRLAGGLLSGQQKTLAQPLVSAIKVLFRDDTGRKKGKSEEKFGLHEITEIWRLLASLEHLPSEVKKELGTIAIDKIVSRKDALSEAAIWAMGRFGERVPLYGPINEIVDAEIVSEWIKKLMLHSVKNTTLFFTMMQMSRKTNDRYRDIDESLRENVITFLNQNNAPDHFISLVKEYGVLMEEDKSEIFGEQLPSGLWLS
jgi:hypothetical protein